MKRLVRFCSYYSESLKKSLADSGIKYEWTQEKPDPYQPNYLIFHLDIDAPEYELILKAIDDAKLRSAPTRTESLSFTKKELDDAEWLHVRPSCKKIDPYDDVTSSRNCPGVGRWTCYATRRTYPLYCKKQIKWGRNHYFYASYDFGYDEMFCSDAARKILHENKIPLVYEPLYDRKMQPVPDVHHMIPLNTLLTEAFDFTDMRVMSDCPICGTKVYGLYGFAQLKIDKRFLHSDIPVYGTPPIFGPIFANKVMVVSQEFRKLLIEHKMERGLVFQPAILF